MQIKNLKLSIYASMMWILIPLCYVVLPVVVAIFASPPLCWDAWAYLILFMAAFVFLRLFGEDFVGYIFWVIVTLLVVYLIYYPLTAWLLRKIF